MPTATLALDTDAFWVIQIDESKENAVCRPNYEFIAAEVPDDEEGWSVISKRGLASAYTEDEPDYS